MFLYSTNVKSRTTYEFGVSYGKPDYTNVVKYSTAIFHNFEIIEVLITTGDRIISIYNEETSLIKEYRRYSKSGDLIEKARDIKFDQEHQQPGIHSVRAVVDMQGDLFFHLGNQNQDTFGWLDMTKNEFLFQSYQHNNTYSVIKFEFDNNQNIFREYYYCKAKKELYKMLEHQYELMEPESEGEDNIQSKLISLVTRMEIINQLMLSQDELEFLKHHLK